MVLRLSTSKKSSKASFRIMKSLSRSSASSMQKAIILAIVSNLAIGAVFCAPSSPPPPPASAATSSSSQSSQASSSHQSAATKQSAAAAAADKPKSPINSSQFSSAASSVSGSPSLVNLQRPFGHGSVGVQRSQAEELADGGAAFDGKNPFADDSLWQIPINLVRDLSEASQRDDGAQNGRDIMAAKSSSNSQLQSGANAGNDDDDDDDSLSQVAPPATSASTNSNSPTIISASTLPASSAATDLKTAAGYHYPSSHEHHGDHYGGHHGLESAGHNGGYGAGHHGGGDHYGGNYFQYASVPYPGAWEFGYRRGNPYHTIERYEHGKGPHFKTKVKWSDKHGGYGVHVWDYNHDDHHSHHYGGHYDSHAPSHYGGGHHDAGHYGHH